LIESFIFPAMKTPCLALLFSVLASLAAAQTTFPGLKAVLSAAEWKRAGLDRLSPDELGVIDAALIRREAGTTAQVQTELAKARTVTAAAPTTPAAPTAQPATPASMSRFGLPLFDEGDWRTMPPLKAKVLKWEGGNRFRLDNGQLWEGFEPITYDLPGKEIEIHARPHGQFVLVVDGVSTTLRIMRLR
jgi:hypothetical protein